MVERGQTFPKCISSVNRWVTGQKVFVVNVNSSLDSETFGKDFLIAGHKCVVEANFGQKFLLYDPIE